MTDDEYSERGDYLASVSEDYHYATHPDPQHPMTEQERAAAIKAYQDLILIQNQNTLDTSAKGSRQS